MEILFNKTKVSEKIEKALNSLEVLTKHLKIMSVGKNSEKKKIVISTKDLNISGLSKGVKFVVEKVGVALKIRQAMPGDVNVRTVSYRSYKNRNGIEPVIDLRHQKLLEDLIMNADSVHITITKSGVTINPFVKVFERIGGVFDSFKKSEEGLYTSIVNAVDIIKSVGYSYIEIETSPDFLNSREYVLFSIQLRRLGYSLTVNGKGKITAKVSGIACPESIQRIPICELERSGEVFRREVVDGFSFESPFSTFVACTSGVDLSVIESDGFICETVLDYRPVEKRDYRKKRCDSTGEIEVVLSDKTDTGMIGAVINGKNVKVALNENIYDFNFDAVKRFVKPFNFMHLSLSCDDFSCLKNMNDRERSIESLDTSVDMFFAAIDVIKKARIPTLLVENVRNFKNSTEAKVFEATLRSLGYQVSSKVLSAVDYNGYSNRERYYLFASALPVDFRFPLPEKRNSNVWDDVILKNIAELREVTHTKSVKKGILTGRIRTIKEGDSYSPAITKSQSRQTKDSVYIEIDGKYFMPSNELLMKIMGFVKGFDANIFNAELTTEVIGQSCEVPMHRNICLSVKEHLSSFLATSKLVCENQVSAAKNRENQLSFSF